MKTSLHLKRIYEPPAHGDGARVLIDRLWPRGVSKKSAALTLWLKEIAPSTALREWFDHDPERWTEFRRRYRAELKLNTDAVHRLRELLASEAVTLLYAAHDPAHNHALVLAEFLESATPGTRKRRSVR